MRAATMGSQADYLGEMEGLPGCTTSSICSPTQLSSALFKQAALVAAQAQQVSGSPLSQRSAGVVQAASTAAAVSTDLQTANSAAVPLAAAEGGRSHHAQPPSCRAEEGSPSGRPGRLVVPKLLLKGLCRPEEPFQVGSICTPQARR